MSSQSPVLVLADAHLRGPQDPDQQTMAEFLESASGQYRKLVLLGDFFEFMAGNNLAATRAYGDVLEGLGRFEHLELIEGNHDFDLCADIPGLQKANIYPSTARLTLAGHDCMALHGDRASPGDVGTRALRAALQSSTIRFLRDQVLPDAAIFHFALWFANMSRTAPWPGRKYEESHTLDMALQLLKQSPRDGVLFAHTHKARLEMTEFGFVANPGAARRDGSYIHLEHDLIELRSFPSGDTIKKLTCS